MKVKDRVVVYSSVHAAGLLISKFFIKIVYEGEVVIIPWGHDENLNFDPSRKVHKVLEAGK